MRSYRAGRSRILILVKDALVIGRLSSFLDGLQQGVYISWSAQRRSVKKFQDRLRRSLCMAVNGHRAFRPILYYDFDFRTLGKRQITLQLYHFSPRDSLVRHIRPSARKYYSIVTARSPRVSSSLAPTVSFNIFLPPT